MNVLAVEFGESEEMIPVVGSPPWTPEERAPSKLALTGISVAAMAPQHGSGPQPRRPVEDSGGQVA